MFIGRIQIEQIMMGRGPYKKDIIPRVSRVTSTARSHLYAGLHSTPSGFQATPAPTTRRHSHLGVERIEHCTTETTTDRNGSAIWDKTEAFLARREQRRTRTPSLDPA